MSKKVLFIGLLVTVPLLVVLGLSFGHDPHRVRSPLVGRAAPPFSLPRVGSTGSIATGDLRGKPALVNFWATWCQPCQAEHGVLQQAARIYGDRVQFVGVVYEDTDEKILDFLARNGSGYPALVDAGGKTAIAYGVTGVPETFFVSPDGTIVDKFEGPLTPGELHMRIGNLLEAR